MADCCWGAGTALFLGVAALGADLVEGCVAERGAGEWAKESGGWERFEREMAEAGEERGGEHDGWVMEVENGLSNDSGVDLNGVNVMIVVWSSHRC